MHGGAAGSGAPKRKRNGKYRHGGFTLEAIDERRRPHHWRFPVAAAVIHPDLYAQDTLTKPYYKAVVRG
jgi:hypothetical protein